MNSLTSLPLSPIKQMTLMSAVVFLASIPMRVLFPTPLPANIPTLCPLPIVNNPSIAFIPEAKGVLIIFLCRGSGGSLYMGYNVLVPIVPFPSMGCPNPSRTRPNKPLPTGTCMLFPVATTWLPGPIPSKDPKGIKLTIFPLKPTTSAKTGQLSFILIISQSSFKFTAGPIDSMVSPMTWDTLPLYLTKSFVSIIFLYFDKSSLVKSTTHSSAQIQRLFLIVQAVDLCWN
ncbi:hypothetical protein SDC9_75041 [bioreactor metagenome]|uniref:Uncharacterized protein n=1 Tax=bioreactor metagenome TaxID=1076179 RepID=A0A644YIU8_9ZZZZ